MKINLFYLAHLVQAKNDLNRRRRRFRAALPKSKWLGYDANSKPMIAEYADSVYTREEAEAGYRKAQAEMRAMTPEMRQVRTELGAQLVWNWSGAIEAIVLENKRYDKHGLKYLADSYLVEQAILGEMTQRLLTKRS